MAKHFIGLPAPLQGLQKQSNNVEIEYIFEILMALAHLEVSEIELMRQDIK
jgi:hypothetical protein